MECQNFLFCVCSHQTLTKTSLSLRVHLPNSKICTKGWHILLFWLRFFMLYVAIEAFLVFSRKDLFVLGWVLHRDRGRSKVWVKKEMKNTPAFGFFPIPAHHVFRTTHTHFQCLARIFIQFFKDVPDVSIVFVPDPFKVRSYFCIVLFRYRCCLCVFCWCWCGVEGLGGCWNVQVKCRSFSFSHGSIIVYVHHYYYKKIEVDYIFRLFQAFMSIRFSRTPDDPREGWLF